MIGAICVFDYFANGSLAEGYAYKEVRPGLMVMTAADATMTIA